MRVFVPEWGVTEQDNYLEGQIVFAERWRQFAYLVMEHRQWLSLVWIPGKLKIEPPQRYLPNSPIRLATEKEYALLRLTGII